MVYTDCLILIWFQVICALYETIIAYMKQFVFSTGSYIETLMKVNYCKQLELALSPSCFNKQR